MATSKPRVVFFLESLAGGGAERVIVTLANEISRRGHPVDLVLVKTEGAYLPLVASTVNVMSLDARSTHFALLPLVKYLNQSRPEVVLSTLTLADLILLFAGRLAEHRPRLVIRQANMVSLHARTWWKKRVERILLRLAYPWADAIVAVSEAVARDVAVYARVPLSRIRTIYNPIIKPDILELAGEETHDPWFGPGEPPVILGMGRLRPEKDFATLLRAFARLRDSSPSRLIILGEGDQRGHLERLAAELGISADVRFPGFVANPFPYLKRAAVFVLSSKYEGLPGALIQALAVGCPVVSTDCPGGVREILGDGRYGTLTPVGDETQMAEAVKLALSGETQPVDRAWLSRFSMETSVEKYFEVLGLN